MTGVEKDLEDARDKIKAGAKAAWNKGKDLGRDLDAEYREQKLKTDTGIGDDLERMADNAKAAATAIGKKAKDTAREFDEEYEREKSKAGVD